MKINQQRWKLLTVERKEEEWRIAMTLSNRQVIALPTPLIDPCQLAIVKLPHPLYPSFSEAYVFFQAW
jgi:hypothetical protein